MEGNEELNKNSKNFGEEFLKKARRLCSSN
jgi:hypothetical protein